MDDHSVAFLAAKAPRAILFVCLGNICRSPLAEGVFRAVAAGAGLGGVTIASAGTGGWHAGQPPDPRAIAVAARNGVDISTQRARRLDAADFSRFDLILGMDRRNVADIGRRGSAGDGGKVGLFMQVALGEIVDVPDPYHGGEAEFESVYRMIRKASVALAGRLAAPAPPSGQASSTT